MQLHVPMGGVEMQGDNIHLRETRHKNTDTDIESCGLQVVVYEDWNSSMSE